MKKKDKQTIEVRLNISEDLNLDTIPGRERWLYQNPKALESVLRGVAQAAAGQYSEVVLPEPPEDSEAGE